jgi:valyl-tRNA synthetase
MKPLAAPAIEVVRDGTVRFVPERYTGVYLNWMENIHDWTISRQLWWGHRIPVWYCSDCAHEWASEAEVETACPVCGASSVYQDPDVLDTWFSSGLWPFSTLGWPDDTPQLARFYPSTVMETGAEIIFFWVARMIFFGLKFTGEAPFSTVYIHGTVRDADGQRMSKTKGNVLEPTQIADKYGTDALRFTLITVSGPGTDLKLAEERVEASRNFANKLYNASRFVLSAIDAADITRDDDGAPRAPAAERLSAPDGWIVTKLHETIADTTRLIEEFQFHEAGRTLYEFLWSEFCDWYIEAAKVRLREGAFDPVVPQTLAYVLERSLRLLHPFMPFVTEELWQRLPHGGPAVIVAPWPTAGARYPELAEQFEAIKEATRLVRNARAEQSVEPARRIAAIIYPGADADIYRSLAGELQFLARIDGESYEVRQGEPEPASNSIAIVSGAATLYLPLASMVDADAERARLSREIEESEAEVRRAAAMLSNEQFVGRAPEQVVQAQRDRLAQAEERARVLRARLAEIG